MMHMVPAAAALVIAAAVSFDQPFVRGYEAPWCAVISMGRGEAYWDCQYRTVEECVPHVIAGNRGFCNPNPAWSGSAELSKRHDKQHRRIH